jgi:hypothetical protein
MSVILNESDLTKQSAERREKNRQWVISQVSKGKTHRQIRRENGWTLEQYLKMLAR